MAKTKYKKNSNSKRNSEADDGETSKKRKVSIPEKSVGQMIHDMLKKANRMIFHVGGKFVDGVYEGGKVYQLTTVWRDLMTWDTLQYRLKACRVDGPVYVCYYDPVDGTKIPLRTDACVQKMFDKYEVGTTITLWATGKFFRAEDKEQYSVDYAGKYKLVDEDSDVEEVDEGIEMFGGEVPENYEVPRGPQLPEYCQMQAPMPEVVKDIGSFEELEIDIDESFWDAATQATQAVEESLKGEGFTDARTQTTQVFEEPIDMFVDEGFQELDFLSQTRALVVYTGPSNCSFPSVDEPVDEPRTVNDPMSFNEPSNIGEPVEEPRNVNALNAVEELMNENDDMLYQCVTRWGEVPGLEEDSVQIPSWDLHSRAGSDEDGDGEVSSKPRGFSEYDLRQLNVELYVGQEFTNAEALRIALRSYAIKKKFDFNWIKSEGSRVTAKCVNDCGWRIHASRVGVDGPMVIKRFLNVHPDSCPECESNNKQATSKFLASKYVHRFRDDPSWRYVGLQSQIHDDMELDVSRYKLMRAKRQALTIIEGNHEEQFSNMREYALLVEKKQPGSYVRVKEVEVPDQNAVRFLRVFYALGVLVQGFKNGCRPFIGLDACFLKTKYKGQLISAVGRDADDSFYPIAFAVVEIENIETWTWFMHHLKEALGDISGITWISDRQKGIQDVFNNMLPNADHRYCIIHIYDNFKKKWAGAEMRKLVLDASYSTTYSGHKIAMDAVCKLNELAHKYLDEIPKNLWCKHKFKGDSQCDLSSNNMCESWNKHVLAARDKPIIHMFEMIRRWMMIRYERKRGLISGMEDMIVPKVTKILKENKDKKKYCKVVYCGHNKFEVDYNGVTEAVNLVLRTCTCHAWDLTGYPCVHGCAAILHRKFNVEDYVSKYYHRETWLKSYEGVIEPMSLRDMRRILDVPVMLPPVPHVQTGRPPKARKKQAGETKKKGQNVEGESSTAGAALGRMRAVCKCSRCQQYGHYARSCKNAPVPAPERPPPSKGGRPKKDPQPHMHVPSESGPSEAGNRVTDSYVVPPRPGRGGGRTGRGGGRAGRGGGRAGRGGGRAGRGGVAV